MGCNRPNGCACRTGEDGSSCAWNTAPRDKKKEAERVEWVRARYASLWVVDPPGSWKTGGKMEFLTEAEANAYAEKCPPRTRVYEMPEVKSRGPADTPKLPTDAQERKGAPIFRGVLMYFPDAIAEVARLSHAATQQHHPDKPMHWDKSKSTDEEDALVRHLMERGTLDTDGQRHSAKAAWRALAMLQREIEAEREPINGADKLGMNGANPSSNGRVPCPCKLRDCLVADGVDMKYAYCVRGKDLPEAAVKHDPFAGGT